MGRKMNIKNAAKELDLPEYFLRESIRKGEIPFLKAGTRYILDVDDVEDFLRRRARENMDEQCGGAELRKGVLRRVK